jgi:hypothetical protein
VYLETIDTPQGSSHQEGFVDLLTVGAIRNVINRYTVDSKLFILSVHAAARFSNVVQLQYFLCWDGEEMKEKVVVLRELDRAIIYNE